MKFLKDNSLSLVLFLILASVSGYLYPQLPEMIATKYDFGGNPVKYSSKEFVALFLPGFYLFTIIFVGILIKASPEKFSMPNSTKAMDIIIFGCGLLFLGMHLGMLLSSDRVDIFVRFFSFGAALFLVTVGNVFGKTERNFFMGIRVPWTLASQANWRATHRMAGRVMVVTGLLLLVLSFFFTSMPVVIAAIIIPTVFPVGYSYVFYRKYELAAPVKSSGV